MKYLSIDLGGTNVKYAIVDHNFTILEKNKFPTNAQRGFDAVLADIVKVVNGYQDISKISISQAGIISKDSSIFFANEKFVDFTGRSFKTELENLFSIQTSCFNDAKSGAQFVADNIPNKNALLMVFGTGVGAAMIIDSKVIFGEYGMTGEIGISNINGKTLDSILSLTNLKNDLSKDGSDVKFSDFTFEGLLGEKYLEYFENLVQWLFNAYVIYGMSSIYLGGSMPAFGDKWLNLLNTSVKNLNKDLTKNLNIYYAPHGEDANLLGALSLALKLGE